MAVTLMQLECALCRDANAHQLDRQKLTRMTSHFGPTAVQCVTEIPFHIFV